MTLHKINVAFDGPSASGKGTTADRLAKFYGLRRFDAGLAYRELAARVISRGFDLQPDTVVCDRLIDVAASCARDLNHGDFAEDYLRSSKISSVVQVTARIEPVREMVRAIQMNLINDGHGVVMDGRDIGTVVMKDTAHVKLFIDASMDVRARRRYNQYRGTIHEKSFDEIRADLLTRDQQDREREHSPMAIAPDAIEINTDTHTVEDTFLQVKTFVDSQGGMQQAVA